jgi:hypothetical protein
MWVRMRLSRAAVLSSAVLSIVFSAACAARQAPDAHFDDLDRSSMVRGRACDRSDQDTTRYLHLPLYRPCAVTVGARRIASDLRPDFMPTGRDRSCFSALIEVAVDTLGRPEMRTARLVRANDAGYGAAAFAIVPGVRFEPARLGGRRVRQIVELREVLIVRRGRGLENAGRGAVTSSGSRAVQTGGQGSGSGAPSSGAELPAPSTLGVVC